uniref:LAM_G_DOMAIN domain-containing protein n=1 Tax=Heterorhabditis bacteriophora TaxID=37862 RepID=A0A1I7XC32_HETBA
MRSTVGMRLGGSEDAGDVRTLGSCADKDVLCEQLCVTLSPETYECGCWNDHILLSDGIGCKVNSTQIEISYTTTAPFVPTPRLKRDRTIWPREKDTAPLSFSGRNFAEFPVANSAYLETNITIEFKYAYVMFDAFTIVIIVAIIGPNIILRHDCGEGAIEDMYRGPFALDTWHTVTVWRKYCDRTEMRVDKKPLMVDLTEQFKFYKGITMDEGVFVGGAPSKVEFLDSKAGTYTGFQGCIRKVIVNDEVLLDTENEINWAVNIEDLEYCSPITQAQNSEEPKVLREIDLSTGLPYKHSGLIMRYSKRFKCFGMLSLSRFSYLFLLLQMNVALPFLLDYNEVIFENLVADRVLTEVNGGTKPLILLKAKENKQTIAPTVRTIIGKTSLELLNVTAPDTTTKQSTVLKAVEFSGGSFITVPAPNDIIDYLELRIHFKPNAHSGVLFLWQDRNNHLGLFLKKGFVNVLVTMGADTAILRSEDVVSLHQWHRAEVWRTGKGILMKVDRQSWVESQLSAVGAVLADPGMLFIGGFNSLLPHMYHLSGFHGCVKKVNHIINSSYSKNKNKNAIL